eukprot:5982199-Prymnesium_polylepis.1
MAEDADPWSYAVQEAGDVLLRHRRGCRTMLLWCGPPARHTPTASPRVRPFPPPPPAACAARRRRRRA